VTTDMTLVQVLDELVHPSGKAAWENSRIDDKGVDKDAAASAQRRLSRGHQWREVRRLPR
jgi:hypothetical protein